MNRTTALIPLHRAEAWVDVVERNARELSRVADVVISDADEIDGTLAQLRDRLADLDTVRFVGARPGVTGWVQHCNELQGRVQTEFHMWLPQDDEVDARWVTEAEAALDADPEAGLACGAVVEHAESALLGGGQRIRLEVPEWATRRTSIERRTAMAGAILHDHTADLGIFFRAVQRTDGAQPLPSIEGDVHADAVWAAHALCRTHAAPLAAIYRKRWHADSEHASWGALTEERPALIAAVSVCAAGDEAHEVREALMEAVADRLDELKTEALLAHIEAATARLAAEAAQRELAAMRDSRSWRMTTLPRRAMAWWRAKSDSPRDAERAGV